MPNILVKGHMRFDETDYEKIVKNILNNNSNLSKCNPSIDQLYNSVSCNINKIETAQIQYKHQGRKNKDREKVKNDIKNTISLVLLMANNLDYDLNDLFCDE